MTESHKLLTINLPPALEEPLLDWLLEHPACPGFTTSAVYGHSVDTRSYNVIEQVTGRQKRVQITILGEAQGLENLLTQMRQQFANAGVRYWITPVLQQGRL